MNMSTVSILMTILNVESYVARAITSILDQAYSDFELIIIDDGSTDSTWPIVSGYAATDDRIVALRNEQNLGTSRALNKALELASGEYITRQDGDDFSMPQRLAKQVDFLSRHPQVGAIGTSIYIIDSNSNVVATQLLPATNDEIQQALLDYMCFCGPTLLVRKQHLREIHFEFNELLSYSEDYDLCLRLAEVTELVNLTEPLYQYRQHSNSVSYQRRHQQMFRKAIALEHAVHRRFGTRLTPDKLTNVARDYLRAAILAYATDQITEAQDCLNHALSANPSLLNSGNYIETWVQKYTPRDSTTAALKFTESIFVELLPQSRHLAQVKGRLLSKLHMHEVFNGLGEGQLGPVDEHLWLGIRNDPSWLLNRGIMSQLIRRFVRVRG
jgi:glycosyltransferase involved in cell wall biosynthesis